MISDTLSDTIAEIKEYLAHGYDDPVIRVEIDNLLVEMERVRALLDTPPPHPAWQNAARVASGNAWVNARQAADQSNRALEQ